MYRELPFLFSLVFVLSSFSSASDQINPNLVGWWKMDDTGTGTVVDYSGYGRDGTLHGNAHFVAGFVGEALALGGDPDYVTIDDYKGILGDNPFFQCVLL